MAGSQSTGGSRDEQGTLISFPRSKWVPDDGIQPLDTGNGHEAAGDGDPPVADEVYESVAQGSRSPAIEATDFWASGDTQEFVASTATAGGRDGDVKPATAAKRVGAAIRRRRLLQPVAVGLALIAVLLLGVEVLTQVRAGYAPASGSAALTPGSASAELFKSSLLVSSDPFGGMVSRRSPAIDRVTRNSAWRHSTRHAGVRAPALNASTAPMTTSMPAVELTGGRTPQASSQPVGSSSSAATAAGGSAISSEPAASVASQSAATAAAPTHPAGPAGPGYVIGSNCNPKCR